MTAPVSPSYSAYTSAIPAANRSTGTIIFNIAHYITSFPNWYVDPLEIAQLYNKHIKLGDTIEIVPLIGFYLRARRKAAILEKASFQNSRRGYLSRLR